MVDQVDTVVRVGAIEYHGLAKTMRTMKALVNRVDAPLDGILLLIAGERRLVSEIDSYRKHQDSAKLDAAVAFFKDTWERGVFGQMFKGQTNNKQRNELIIFIRPTVLRTDDQAMAEAARRTRALNLGRDLDLEQFFPTPEAPTNWPAYMPSP